MATSAPHRLAPNRARPRPRRIPSPHPLLTVVAATTLGVAITAKAQDTVAPERSPPGEATLPAIRVSGNYDNTIGSTDAASAGRVTPALIPSRPLLRPAEVLELVPGLVVTQHSGDGKANQYFLRGFNLDHGTDFATSVDGMPVNLPTHAHGHGYTDLNFLIAETIDTIDYAKGPYRAADGDFASAGSAAIGLRNRFDAPTATVTAGGYGYRRLFAGYSPSLGDDRRRLLVATEAHRYDGPWVVAENLHRLNAMVRLSDGSARHGWSATLMGYRGHWDATDQVPRRAIDAGLIDRFGSLDPTSGGRTNRVSASANVRRELADGSWQANAYAIRYRLDLFSNFTYALDNTVGGDQFEQADRRNVFGAGTSRLWRGALLGLPTTHTVGAQVRHDRIDVGLHDTVARERTDTVRADAVRQTLAGVHYENGLQLTPWLRSVAGIRHDRLEARTDAGLAQNGGRTSDGLTSPKLSLIAGPWQQTEFFANVGRGFHSNDARGTTTRIDPRCARTSPLADCAVDPVAGLVRSTGRELGIRTEALPDLQSSLALWQLDIGSELLFVGDAGTTEASRPSRRRGLELNNRWTPRPWLIVDADLAWSRARFTDGDPAGAAVPGAVSRVGALSVTLRDRGPWFGTLTLRHLGTRPLVEDRSQVASSFTLANLRAGYRFNRQVRAWVDVFNLFDRQANDIEYFYESRLRGEAVAVADRHVHPVEPRTVRLSLQVAL